MNTWSGWAQRQLANVAGTKEPIYGPEAIRSVAEQAKTTPYTELTKEDLKWDALNSTNVETQTFYFYADSGHICMAQVIYNNIAGLRTTVQFNTKVFYPDRSKPILWSSDPLYNHGFTDDNTSFHADGVSMTLSEDGTSYRIKSSVNTSSIVDVTMTRTAPGFQVGTNGTTYYGTDPNAPWGSMRHRFWPRNKVEGTVLTKEGPIDFHGKGYFIHALQGMKPHHAAARWNFVHFESPTYSAIMMEFTTPPSYGSTLVNVGGIVKDGEIVYAGISNSATHQDIKGDADNEWPEPGAIDFLWEGKSKDGKDVVATLSGPYGQRLDRIDVMAEVPGFIKQVVGVASGARPYIYQYSPDPKWSIKVKEDGEEKEEQGLAFSEVTFIC